MPPANKTKTIGLLTIGLVEASSLAATCLKLAESDSGRPVAITVADVQGESLVVLQQDGVSWRHDLHDQSGRPLRPVLRKRDRRNRCLRS
jgi:hypothetical protein